MRAFAEVHMSRAFIEARVSIVIAAVGVLCLPLLGQRAPAPIMRTQTTFRSRGRSTPTVRLLFASSRRGRRRRC